MKAKLLPLILLLLYGSVLAEEKQTVVYITGQINRPGVIEFHEGISVWEAIVAAGGISRLGRPEFVIKREGKETSVITQHYDFTNLPKEQQIEKMKSIKLEPRDYLWLYDRETEDIMKK